MKSDSNLVEYMERQVGAFLLQKNIPDVYNVSLGDRTLESSVVHTRLANKMPHLKSAPYCSSLDFCYDRDSKRIDIMNIQLLIRRQNIGLGGYLIESLEGLAKESGMSELRIKHNHNEDFWTHMGFVPVRPGIPLTHWHKVLD